MERYQLKGVDIRGHGARVLGIIDEMPSFYSNHPSRVALSKLQAEQIEAALRGAKRRTKKRRPNGVRVKDWVANVPSASNCNYGDIQLYVVGPKEDGQ